MARFNYWTWFKNIFKNLKKQGAHMAVVITEEIKTALNTSAAGFLATTFDTLTHTQLAENVLSALKKYIPEVLAAELALEGLPDNPTADDILKFETDILNAFGKLDKKSKFYSTFAAEVFGIIKETIEATPETPPTFAELVAAVEKVYVRYQLDKAASQDDAA